jgi:hypothetical protein
LSTVTIFGVAANAVVVRATAPSAADMRFMQCPPVGTGSLARQRKSRRGADVLLVAGSNGVTTLGR